MSFYNKLLSAEGSNAGKCKKGFEPQYLAEPQDFEGGYRYKTNYCRRLNIIIFSWLHYWRGFENNCIELTSLGGIDKNILLKR